jgi:lysozyme family protein
MAEISKVNFGYIKKWEGGLSRDSHDPASRYPVPDGKGYHTNIGVTWQAFHAHFPNLKPDDFYAMPSNLWLQIYHDGYWNAVRADEIDNQIIAEFLADWAWGSGAYAPIVNVQRMLSANGYTCAVDGVIGKVTLGQLNSMVKVRGAKSVFDLLYSQRTSFLQSLKQFSLYGTGWMNRMRDFKAYAYTAI